jgi:hypothetical protein
MNGEGKKKGSRINDSLNIGGMRIWYLALNG